MKHVVKINFSESLETTRHEVDVLTAVTSEDRVLSGGKVKLFCKPQGEEIDVGVDVRHEIVVEGRAPTPAHLNCQMTNHPNKYWHF